LGGLGVQRLTATTTAVESPSFEAVARPSVTKLLKDREPLLAHFGLPAEHWVHLRSTNAIESTFATVRLRTARTKGAGSRAAGLAMAYKLLAAAEQRWRCVNAPHLVAPCTRRRDLRGRGQIGARRHEGRRV